VFSVEFTAESRADISREIKQHWDGREMGGALVGRIDGYRIVVEHAGGLGVGVETKDRTAWSMRPPLTRYFDLACALGADLVGGWHTHSGRTDTRASEADREVWEDVRVALESPVYVGLIFAPRRIVVPGLVPGLEEEMWSFEAPHSVEIDYSTYLVTDDACEYTIPTFTGEDRHALSA
jgi:hypothetical protein